MRLRVEPSAVDVDPLRVTITPREPRLRAVGGESSRLLLDGMDMADVTLDDILANRQIAAIEVYTTPETVPVEFRRHGTCGVIAIWTER